MSKHYFKESLPHGSTYNVVIYCEWCGLVVWHFNHTEAKDKYQLEAETQCIANTKLTGGK